MVGSAYPYKIKTIGIITGLTLSGLALVVLVGWHARLPELIQVHSSFAPVQYNTAVGLLLTGCSFLALAFRKHLAVRITSMVVLLLGILSGLQYVLGVDFGIDEALMDHYIQTRTSQPGRMAPNSAIAFILIGTGLFVYALKIRNFSLNNAVTGIISAVTLSIGLIAALGYLLGIESAFGWSNFTRMAFLASGGFVTCGLGLFSLSITRSYQRYNRLPQWLPVPIIIGLATFTLALWQTLNVHEHKQINRLVAMEGNRFTEISGEMLGSQFQALVRMADRWSERGEMPYHEWLADANNYLDHQSGLNGIGWIDTQGKLSWFIPEAGHRPIESTVFEGVKFEDSPEIQQIENGQFMVILPIGSGTTDHGHLYGLIGATEIFNKITSGETVAGYSFEIRNRGNTLYRSKGFDPDVSSAWKQSNRLTFYGHEWEVHFWPNGYRLKELTTAIPENVLIFGLLISLLVGLTVHQTSISQKRKEKIEQINDVLRDRIEEKKRNEQRIQELYRELETKIQQLEQANSDLESFSYSISHDLRAPLRALTGFSDALLDEYTDQLEGDGMRWLKIIKKNAGRMDVLINDILTLSKTSRQEITKQNVDLETMISEILEEQSKLYNGKPIEVQTGEIMEMYGDRILLRQLWENLISNAIKYSSKKEKIKIKISGSCSNGDVHYLITDNGAGFDESYKDKLFQVFQRLHREEDFPGTGVGLAIVKRIVDRHDGRIRAESKVGEGATFHITLPNQNPEK